MISEATSASLLITSINVSDHLASCERSLLSNRAGPTRTRRRVLKPPIMVAGQALLDGMFSLMDEEVHRAWPCVGFKFCLGWPTILSCSGRRSR